MRSARHVNVVGGKVEEEWFVLVALDELDPFVCECIGHVFVLPERRFAASHEPDAANPINDGVMMAMAPIELERVALGNAVWLAGKSLPVANAQRIVGVE